MGCCKCSCYLEWLKYFQNIYTGAYAVDTCIIDQQSTIACNYKMLTCEKAANFILKWLSDEIIVLNLKTMKRSILKSNFKRNILHFIATEKPIKNIHILL